MALLNGTIGKKIRVIRERSWMPRELLAVKTGLTEPAIVNIEHGAAFMDGHLLTKIAIALNVSTD